MITSPTSARIASVIAWKSSISYDGVPSGVRAWMWICDPPSSTMRRASAAYSSGVYGIAGHWSRLAIAPLIEQLMTTGSSKRLIWGPPMTRKTAHPGSESGPMAFYAPYRWIKRRSPEHRRRAASFEPYRWKICRSLGRRPGTPGPLPSVPVVREPHRSYGHHAMLLPRALDALARGHPQAADDRGACLARIDDVVDQVVVGGDV